MRASLGRESEGLQAYLLDPEDPLEDSRAAEEVHSTPPASCACCFGGEGKGAWRVPTLITIDEARRRTPWAVTPFIHTHYRPTMPMKDAFRSLFYLHNETGNVYTHGIGLVGYLVFALVHFTCDFAAPLRDSDANFAMSIIYFFSTCFMLAASAVYHTVTCVSQRCSERHLTCDLLGIVIQILGLYCWGFWHGFQCSPVIRTRYMVAVGVLTPYMVLVAVLPLCKRFHAVVVVSYALFVAAGLVPVAHFAHRTGIFSAHETPDPADVALMGGICVMFAFYLIGVIFYVTHWPERRWPGSFDVLGHSHQWWHIGVMLAPGAIY
eukprot:CAMPEP_0170161018 /NCGR_PEP_ID=MMETSP0033_2-20121228/74982_1 /TAXON_ID=195969 /ORGANISM="Dolichomastix tenuilepis, Strain CCMP3274" /LENGTH=321 /DNA_ID=CAMNT_0010398607 /DNA_START=29 /DNA_END=991 /DNA_ORIENTATION=+